MNRLLLVDMREKKAQGLTSMLVKLKNKRNKRRTIRKDKLK